MEPLRLWQAQLGTRDGQLQSRLIGARMAHEADILIIGAGIAGASVAAHLAENRKVTVLEMEERPGYHSTGRSAAAYEPNYGPPAIRALTRAARAFYEHPPQGFANAPLLEPRETLFLVPPGQESAAQRTLAGSQGLEEISLAEAHRRLPLIRQSYAKSALLDRGTADIDVDLLHQGYLRMLKSRGGQVVCNAAARNVERSNGHWHVKTAAGGFAAPVLVNAAGAWGDAVARLAGARRRGLEPRRRSIAVISAPSGVMAWPLVGDAGETWYAKPSGGKLLVSPADATPVEPHDAYADDMTLAEGIDRFQQAIDIPVDRLEHSWGGLRTFAPDGDPVVGYDSDLPRFFWLVGQGGYGIQTAPALSRLAAALIREEAPPADIAAEGLRAESLSPNRVPV
jgi:D-arginine dehydrogenase